MTAIGLDAFPESGFAERRAVLPDLGGCFVCGGTALPSAGRLGEHLGPRLSIGSNKSVDTAGTLAVGLADLGLPVAPEPILLAGGAAVPVTPARILGRSAPHVVKEARADVAPAEAGLVGEPPETGGRAAAAAVVAFAQIRRRREAPGAGMARAVGAGS